MKNKYDIRKINLLLDEIRFDSNKIVRDYVIKDLENKGCRNFIELICDYVDNNHKTESCNDKDTN